MAHDDGMTDSSARGVEGLLEIGLSD